MAFRLTCDNPRCGKVLQQDTEGQPSLRQKRHVYCPDCAAFVDEVEAQLREHIDRRAHELTREVETMREELLRTSAAPQRFDGEGDNRTPPAASSPSESLSPSFPPRIIADQS